MAHFAKVDKDTNVVLDVFVIMDNEIQDDEGNESEALGVDRCIELFGDNYKWVQTSYNRHIRDNYAGVGSKYDEKLDTFIPPKSEEFDSWVLNTDTIQWIPPLPYPKDGNEYSWDETNISWMLRQSKQ
jgi:hypothetical protein